MRVFKFSMIVLGFLIGGLALWKITPRTTHVDNIALAYPVVWSDVAMFEQTLQKN